MFSILLISSAIAGTVEGGVQVAAFQSGFGFVAERLEGQIFNIDRDLVSSSDVACYDEVGIRDLNVEIPVDGVSLDLKANSLVIDVHFGRIHGEDMKLFAADSDTWDACPSLEEVDFRSFEIENARILVEMRPLLSGGDFQLEILGEPSISGDLSTDIEWVPDALILSFVEDTIFETVEDLFLERVPALAAALVDTSLFVGELGDIGLDVQLTDIDTGRSALSIGMDVDAEWLGDGCEISGIISEPAGRNPRVNFGDGLGHDVGIAVTEYQLNRLFHGAWADGLLCFGEGPLSDIAESVEALIGDSVEDSEVALDFSSAPQFIVDAQAISVAINDLHFSMSGKVDGEDTLLVALDASLKLGAEVRVDHAVSSFALSLTTAELSIDSLQLDALLEESAGASGRLEQFLEGWAMETLSARINNVPLYGNLFHVADIYVRITDVDTEGGAVVILGALYDGDDPEVDTEPPETSARITSATDLGMSFEMQAEDNSAGPFAFSYRLDSGSWSDWFAENTASITLPDPGEHYLEVRARDAWLNVDPSPSRILFAVDDAGDDADKGCECATGGSSQRGLWAVVFVMIVGLSRRRE